MALKSKELGRIPVDAGDVVVFSRDMVDSLAEEIGEDGNDLIERCGGVLCNFQADGNYGVDQLTAVDNEGRTYPVVLIGANPDTFLRFLEATEPGFGEYYRQHPKFREVGQGNGFNKEVFAEIADEYRKKLLEKTK
jgi:hypothetical protein